MWPLHGGKWFTEMSIGRNLSNYDSLFALTHFKGHVRGGFGGANKNVAIGCADGRVGKAMQHTAEGSDNMWSIGEEEFMERMVEASKAVLEFFGDKVCYVNVMRQHVRGLRLRRRARRAGRNAQRGHPRLAGHAGH